MKPHISINDSKVLAQSSEGSYWTAGWRRLLERKVAIVSLAIFFIICIACLAAPYLSKWGYIYMDDLNKMQGPSAEHLLGTDEFGRDLFARILYGGRLTLKIALGSTVIAVIVGSIIGIAAGYYGGYIDLILSPILDILGAIPVIVLAIFAEAALGWGKGNFMYALAGAAVPQFARIVRASVMSIAGSEYIEAARALGVTSPGIIVRHIIPGIASPLIIRFTTGVAEALLSCTIIGYLGIGINPPNPEWGQLVYRAKPYLRLEPYLIMIPCAVITISVISVTLFGDGLRKALDPRKNV